MYHEMAAHGMEQFLRSTGEVVRVVEVKVNGRLEVILPDLYDEDGELLGHGGSLSVMRGDFLVGKQDGSIFGVAGARYSELLSSAPVSIPVADLSKEE